MEPLNMYGYLKHFTFHPGHWVKIGKEINSWAFICDNNIIVCILKADKIF